METTMWHIMAGGASDSPTVGTSGDRGCVSCGFIIPWDKDDEATAKQLGRHTESDRTFIADARGRYWCLNCACNALADIRRRVDERENGPKYPWHFTGETKAGGRPSTSPSPVHVLSQDDQPYGSERRCCNHCGVMIWPEARPDTPSFVSSWEAWRSAPNNCSKVA